MRPKTWSYSPLTTAATRYGSGVTLATSATLAQTTPGDSLAHLVTITGIAATNHSGKTMTITGTDADGRAISEGIAGPNGAVTVTSTLYFKTVTSVVASATCGADTFNIGFNVVGLGPTIPLDSKLAPFEVGLQTDISGTINYTIQYTLQNIWDPTINPSTGVTWVDNASPMAGATADQTSNYTFPAMATRVKVNSVTNGATLKYTVAQGREA